MFSYDLCKYPHGMCDLLLRRKPAKVKPEGIVDPLVGEPHRLKYIAWFQRGGSTGRTSGKSDLIAGLKNHLFTIHCMK